MLKASVISMCLAMMVSAATVTLSPADTYTIVLPDKATVQERYSAALLSEYLKDIYEATVSIAAENTNPPRPWISIGETELAKKHSKEPLPFQSYSLAVDEQDLLIRGGKPGPLNGVLSYLDEDLGVRWYAEPYANIKNHPDPGLKVIPKLKGRAIAVNPRTYTPPFVMREVMYMYGTSSNPESTLYFRHAPYSYHSFLPKNSGGLLNSYFFVHTYSSLIPEKLYDEHPEYFALQNGKRVHQTSSSGSICYTNPDVCALMVRTISENKAKNPDAIYFSVEANDTAIPQCECPQCTQLIEKYGIAGIQLWLANKVAEQLVKDYPDICISTLVYGTNLLKESDLRAHPNVMLCLAPVGARWNEVQTLVPLPDNKAICNSLAYCKKIASRICFWDYLEVPNMPFPTFDQYRESIRFLASQDVRYYFADCTNNGMTLTPVKKWVYARLLWNPDENMDALIEEFAHAYYTDAAEEILEYIEVIRNAWKRFKDNYDKEHDGVYLTYTAEERGRMRGLFERAMSKASGNEILAGRVAREYMIFLIMELSGNPQVTGVERYRNDTETAKKLMTYAPSNAFYLNYPASWEKKLAWVTRKHRDDEYSPNTVTIEKSLTVAGMSEYLDDAKAHDGKAMKHYGKMPWGIQWYYNTFLDYLKPDATYVLRIRVRPELKKARTSGAMFGFYAFHHGNVKLNDSQPVFSVDFTEDDASGEYRWIVLGKIHVKKTNATGMFWMDAKIDSDEALWYDCLEIIPIEEFRELDQVPDRTMEI